MTIDDETIRDYLAALFIKECPKRLRKNVRENIRITYSGFPRKKGIIKKRKIKKT